MNVYQIKKKIIPCDFVDTNCDKYVQVTDMNPIFSMYCGLMKLLQDSACGFNLVHIHFETDFLYFQFEFHNILGRD